MTEDDRAMKETAYLLKSSANAKELLESIEQAEKGELIEMKIMKLKFQNR